MKNKNMDTKRESTRKTRTFVVRAAQSISFGADSLSSERKISKERARYILEISSAALSTVTA